MGEGGYGDGGWGVGVDVGPQVTGTFSSRAAGIGSCKDHSNPVFKCQSVCKLCHYAVGIVVSVRTPRIGHHTNVVRILTGRGMSVRPLQSLFSSENRRTIARSEGHELTTFRHSSPSTTGGIPVTSDGPADVRSVSRRGVGISSFSPTNAVKLGRVNRLFTRPRLKVVVIGMPSINPRVKIHNSRAIAIPLRE